MEWSNGCNRLRICKNAAKETKNTFGNIDILVCNAGIAGPSLKTWEYPAEEWQQVIDIDLQGFQLPPCCLSDHDRTKVRKNC
ncbi:MAG: hypothetical protein CM1200mP1_16820 [Candidatus Neomarinimicrobiota bacterium]|nr:MAG: hypothetical protein CM1200mP1_16820 [Candidatus Neomarinimicrobiota bacterium]